MTHRLEGRVSALEQQTSAGPDVDRIILVPGKDGDPLDGATLERQPSGEWTSRPVTQEDVEQCTD